MVSPVQRQVSAKAFQAGKRYRYFIDPNEVLDFTVDFYTAFPAAATSFVLSGTVDYGTFTAPVAAVVSASLRTVTLYITGQEAGLSSNIVVRGAMTSDSTTLVVEVSFVLTARDSVGQVPSPITTEGYYATAADLDAHLHGVPVFMKSGLYYSPGTSIVSMTPVLNTVYAFPYLIGKPTTIDRLAIDVTGTDGTETAVGRIGIYEDTGVGYPGDLLIETALLDVDTTGLVSATVSVVLPAGIIWFAYVAQVVINTVRGITGTGSQWPIGVVTPSAALSVAYTAAGVAGALTDPFTLTVTPASGNMPRVYFRVA